jgi:hypothetical protein
VLLVLLLLLRRGLCDAVAALPGAVDGTVHTLHAQLSDNSCSVLLVYVLLLLRRRAV